MKLSQYFMSDTKLRVACNVVSIPKWNFHVEIVSSKSSYMKDFISDVYINLRKI